MSEPTLRQRLRLHVLRSSYNHAIICGILSLRYDFERRRIMHSRPLQLYACGMNALVLLLTAYACWHSRQLFDFFDDNPVMQLTHLFNMYVRFATVLLTLLLRWRREQSAQRIVSALLRLESSYFDGKRAARGIDERFDRMLLRKYVVWWCQLLIMLPSSVQILPGHSWLMYLARLYLVGLLHILNAVLLHYFLALWHICKRFCILNAQLAGIYNTLCRRGANLSVQRSLAAQLDTLARVHCRLTCLLQQLNDSYKFQVMAIILAQMIKTVSMGYFGAVIYSGKSKLKIVYLQQLVGVLLYASNVYGNYLLDLLCDAVEQEALQTVELLQRFNAFAGLDEQLERSCNSLAQQLSVRRPQVRISGMFNMNKSCAFHICCCIFSNTLLLLQFDIKNRRGLAEESGI